jgi:hypothetical protein
MFIRKTLVWILSILLIIEGIYLLGIWDKLQKLQKTLKAIENVKK